MATQAGKLNRAQVPTRVMAEISAADRAVSASMIASGIGSLVLGIAIVLAEVNAGIKTFLTWNSGVGPLSGKTGVAVLAFLASWGVLHYVFQRNPLTLMRSFVVTIVLLVLGLLLTFPPVFLAFGG